MELIIFTFYLWINNIFVCKEHNVSTFFEVLPFSEINKVAVYEIKPFYSFSKLLIYDSCIYDYA